MKASQNLAPRPSQALGEKFESFTIENRGTPVAVMQVKNPSYVKELGAPGTTRVETETVYDLPSLEQFVSIRERDGLDTTLTRLALVSLRAAMSATP